MTAPTPIAAFAAAAVTPKAGRTLIGWLCNLQSDPAREGALLWKILVVGAAILAIVVGGLWVVIRMTAPVADAATHFVITAGSAGPAAAYAEAAPGLRRAMPEPVFEARLRQLGLTRARSASWSNRSLNGDDAIVSGMVKLASGESTPLTVHLAKSNGGWRVSDLAYGIPTPIDN